MPSVSVLYIDDLIVGPYLELLRAICEPDSKSRPHVTVRYFDRLLIPDEYKTTTIGHIDITEPASFGLDEAGGAMNRTVFLRCQSDDLMPLEHKPHYPTSEFHITVYDGGSKSFAQQLLKTLKKFRWRFRVLLPSNTTLTTIMIEARKKKLLHSPRHYTPILHRIFHEATHEPLSWFHLKHLSDNHRVRLVEAVCRHLHRAVTRFKRISAKQEPILQLRQKTHPGHKETPQVHLTPPELAREIAEYAVDLLGPNDTRIHFGDPAVGTGAFYAGLLQTVGRNRIASAMGVDISHKQVLAAKTRWGHKGMEVRQGDYLYMDQLPLRTLILANPPYLRHQGIPKNYKHKLRDRASIIIDKRISARSGMYQYFLLLSHTWMKSDAIAAWLIPSEFMQTSYGSALRDYLTRKVQLVRIHQFAHDDQKFENVLVLPCVVVFRNATPHENHIVTLSTGDTLHKPRQIENVLVDELRRKEKWSIPMRSVRMHKSSDIYIRDLFTVRRGIATGANEFFVLAREEAHRLGIPKAYLRPILPKSRTLEKDVIDRGADGYPLVESQLCLLDCDLPLEEIKNRFPRLLEYLKSAGESIRERYLVQHRQPWYKQESRKPAMFLCTYMGRHRENGSPVRFILNKSDAIATNTYLMLYPRGGLARLLEERSETAQDLFELLKETSQESMKANWRVHAGGLHKIEPGDLLNVRLSSSPQWLIDAIDPVLHTAVRLAHN